MKTFPQHDRPNFFKYTSAATAIKILESSAVLYRSPIQFNDPFDIQSGLHFDFDARALPDKIFDQIELMVSADTPPNVSDTEPFGKAIHLMWNKKSTHGFPKDDLRELFRPGLASLSQLLLESQKDYQRTWWDDFLPRLRVFSVSEEKDNLLMWSHYANNHTGVVIDFRVLPIVDNPLCVAKPVQYFKHPPALLTEQQYINSVLGVSELEPGLLLNYACIKSDVWTYEKEWRVWDLLPTAEDKLFSYYPVDKDEIGAIYFGCNINPEDKNKIIKLLSDRSRARAFQAVRSSNHYRLDFSPFDY